MTPLFCYKKHTISIQASGTTSRWPQLTKMLPECRAKNGSAGLTKMMAGAHIRANTRAFGVRSLLNSAVGPPTVFFCKKYGCASRRQRRKCEGIMRACRRHGKPATSDNLPAP